MKKIIISILIILAIIIGVYYFLRHEENNSYEEKGNKMVIQIYEFEKIHNKLPNSISDFKADTEMGEGPYYEKLNDSTFIVFFNIGFDDKIIFNSNNNKWE
ncbi:hypothetical protein SAMN05444396_1196 [Flavobacterium segetis]|uniref:Uncharacterized protein n=1 Tax=Flavobacterium segetis TaxID=271157 RepID=A0A1M5K3T9_9FLAO|nr:hypothetical protein [Flavobacterium segetis]SHG47270.1 hypothetical protein SAMN05444396_1196 [Flavobacterium segetis]